jgi:hypothetical protein
VSTSTHLDQVPAATLGCSPPHVPVLSRRSARFTSNLARPTAGEAAESEDAYTVAAARADRPEAVTSQVPTTLGHWRLRAARDETMRERIWQSTGTASGFT